MCGRLVGFRKIEELKQYFPIDQSNCEAVANYNVAPTQQILAIARLGQSGYHDPLPLVPLTIDLGDGQIRNAIMRSRNGNLKIQVSYLRGELLIDDTPGNGRKGTRLGFIPGWKNGQSYVIESSGSRLLEDLDVFILSQ